MITVNAPGQSKDHDGWKWGPYREGDSQLISGARWREDQIDIRKEKPE